jgi:hypothetical protein
MKRLLAASTIIGLLQLLFAVVCAYMVAAINDNVWHGVKLDDLAWTSGAIGLIWSAISLWVCLLFDILDD